MKATPLRNQIAAARRVATPLIGISTADPAGTLREVSAAMKPEQALLVWDTIRGIRSGDKAREQTNLLALLALAVKAEAADDIELATVTQNPVAMLELLPYLEPNACVVMYGAGRIIDKAEVAQAVWNLRDLFKDGRTLVLTGPFLQLPAELCQDVMLYDDALPSDEEIGAIVLEIYRSGDVTPPCAEMLDRCTSALRGLSAFAAEQCAATALTPSGMNIEILWDRKRRAVEQTPGLRFTYGGQGFDSIGGLSSLKELGSGLFANPAKRPGVVVFIDEIEKWASGIMGGSGDNGVDKDAFSVVLREIAEHEYPGITLVGPPGTGKCHGKDTPIMMSNGMAKMVQDVRVGESLMGPDGKSRRVLSVATGIDDLYRVIPTKGDAYTINSAHILSLKMSSNASGHKKGDIVNICLADYLASSGSFKHYAKGYRVGLNFEEKPVLIDPYVFGVWLGDGHTYHPLFTTPEPEIVDYLRSYADNLGLVFKEINHQNAGAATTYSLNSGIKGNRCHGVNTFLIALEKYGVIGKKEIPSAYLINSRQVRLELLAGIIDTDGFLTSGGYEITFKSEILMDDVIFLARSLGFAAYKKERKISLHEAHEEIYYRAYISGDVDEIPVIVPRRKAPPRKMNKSVLNVGITIEPIGRGDYYGFTLDGDHLYLLGDFTVTHNTIYARALAAENNVPLLEVDLGEAKGSLVGESQQKIRGVFRTIHALAGPGGAIIVAAANSLPDDIPSELMRRVAELGVYFVDLPDGKERDVIWDIQMKRFGIESSGLDLYFDKDWTGAEIRACCNIATRLNCDIQTAAKRVIPISRSNPESINRLRKQAAGRWQSANEIGPYVCPSDYEIPKPTGNRKIDFEGAK